MNRISLGGAPNNLMFNKKINKMKGKIFNAQEVQAIISKQKTMFREVIKPQPNSNINPVKLDYLCRTWQWATKESRRECPYQVGQKIFCKESFWEYSRFGDEFKYDYDADTDYTKCLPDGFPIQRIPLGAWEVKKLPAQHMKQEHSRISLLIKEIKVERLQDISAEDCAKEGIAHSRWQANGQVYGIDMPITQAFGIFWNATHKKPEEKFEASPFVWCVNFEVINN